MKRILSAASSFFILHSAFATAIPESQAVDAVLGEAGKYTQAMLPIACIIRDRGSLQGIYGWQNPAVKTATPQMRARARAAWRASARHSSLVTRHCRFFGCPGDASYLRDELHLRPVFAIGPITFYTDRKP